MSQGIEMNRTWLFAFVAMGGLFLISSCASRHVPAAYLESLRSGGGFTLLEGLPREVGDKSLFFEEYRTKQTEMVQGFRFYERPLNVAEPDVERLKDALANSALYRPYVAAACGEFHPDFAVSWQASGESYVLLICFTCGEVRGVGPNLNFRNSLESPSWEELESLLDSFRKNLPPRKARRL